MTSVFLFLFKLKPFKYTLIDIYRSIYEQMNLYRLYIKNSGLKNKENVIIFL